MHLTGGMSLSLFLLFPLFVKSLGGSEATIGFLLGVGAAASVAVRPAVGVAARSRWRAGRCSCGSASRTSCRGRRSCCSRASGRRCGPAPSSTTSCGAPSSPRYFTYAADLAPPLRRAEAIAMFGVAGMTANGIAPILGERVIDAGGYAAYFALAMALGWRRRDLALGSERPARVHHEHRRALRDALGLLRNRGIATVMVVTALLGSRSTPATSSWRRSRASSASPGRRRSSPRIPRRAS
jgi:hypothetical protein